MVSNCFEITLQKELQDVDEAVTLLQAQIHEFEKHYSNIPPEIINFGTQSLLTYTQINVNT
jgi:archaellum component FlaC